MVSPNADYNWIPSNIWVGVGRMNAGQVDVPAGAGVPEEEDRLPAGQGSRTLAGGRRRRTTAPAVEIEYTLPGRAGERERIDYDYLINATGPKLNFAATPGLGPDNGYSVSVCTASHATHAAAKFEEVIAGSNAASRNGW